MPEPGPPRTTTRRRVSLFVALFLVVQIAIPLTQFVTRWVQEGTRPTHELALSYQMYSATMRAAYEGVGIDGTSRPLSTDRLPYLVRAVSYGDTVQRLFCEADPTLVSVTRLRPNGSTGVFTC